MVSAFGYSVTNLLLPLMIQMHSACSELMAASVTSYTAGALGGAIAIASWKLRSIGWVALSGLALYELVPLSLVYANHAILPVAGFFVAGIDIDFLFPTGWPPLGRRFGADERAFRNEDCSARLLPDLLWCSALAFAAPEPDISEAEKEGNPLERSAIHTGDAPPA